MWSMVDFRSDKSDSREGKGVARRAWESYRRQVEQLDLPLVDPLARRFSLSKVVDLVGFWVAWQLHGGFEGLRKLGMSERTIYRRIAWFRMAYGEHPDTFEMPGVNIDREAYFAAGRRRPRAR